MKRKVQRINKEEMKAAKKSMEIEKPVGPDDWMPGEWRRSVLIQIFKDKVKKRLKRRLNQG